MWRYFSKQMRFTTSYPVAVCIQRLQSGLDFRMLLLRQAIFRQIAPIPHTLQLTRLHEHEWQYQIELKHRIWRGMTQAGITGTIRAENGQTIITGQTYLPVGLRVFYSVAFLLSLLLLLFGLLFEPFIFLISLFFLPINLIQVSYNLHRFSTILVTTLQKHLQ